MPSAKRRIIPALTDEQEAAIQAGMARDADNPKLTDEELAALRPAAEVLPAALYAALTRRRPGERGPGRQPAKVQVTIRLDRAAVDAWKASGPGWQARINDLVAREAPKAER